MKSEPNNLPDEERAEAFYDEFYGYIEKSCLGSTASETEVFRGAFAVWAWHKTEASYWSGYAKGRMDGVDAGRELRERLDKATNMLRVVLSDIVGWSNLSDEQLKEEAEKGNEAAPIILQARSIVFQNGGGK